MSAERWEAFGRTVTQGSGDDETTVCTAQDQWFADQIAREHNGYAAMREALREVLSIYQDGLVLGDIAWERVITQARAALGEVGR